MNHSSHTTSARSSLRRFASLAVAAAAVSGSALVLPACGAKQATSSQPVWSLEDVGPLPDRCAEEACINHGVDSFDVDGIHVIVKHEASPPLVVANIYFEGGALHWNAENAGHESLALAAATEGGPSTLDRLAYHSALEEVAATVSASSSVDYSVVSLFSPAFALDRTFGLMSQSLLSPAFEEQQVANSRAQQLASIQTRFDSADNAVHEVARSTAWAGHPYAIHPQGSEESVQAATPVELRSALQKLLVREKMTVVFVGQLDNAQARRLVEQHLHQVPHEPDWAAALNYPEAFAPFAYANGSVQVMERPEIPTNYIAGYFAAPSPGEADYAPMVLATQILRDRLFEEVRTRRNLSYAVYSAIATRRANTGVLYVTATKPAETLKVMYDTIDALVNGEITQEDVDNEIRTYLTHYYMDLQSFGAQASLLARWELLTGSRVDADRFIDELRSVTPAQVSDVLNRYMKNIQFGVLGHPSQIDTRQFSAR